MSLDLPALRDACARHGPVVRILLVDTQGSVPREAGTSMLVHASGTEGTIGGGALESQAIETARGMLAGGAPQVLRVPLGPALGQCCGGHVTLALERLTAETLPDAAPWARPVSPEAGPRPSRAPSPGMAPVLKDGWLVEAGMPAPEPLWLWGAGHVGRAIAAVIAPWPGVALTWVDLGPERFPDRVPPGVTALPAAAPATLVPYAPRTAHHLVATRSHALDLDLCHALLGHGFASCGLIGSATKMARFRSRLGALGHAPELIAQIECPIGDPSLGKHPQAIAIGVAARHIARLSALPRSLAA